MNLTTFGFVFPYIKEKLSSLMAYEVRTARRISGSTSLTESDYPLEIGKKAIEFYQGYFGIEYPLPR